MHNPFRCSVAAVALVAGLSTAAHADNHGGMVFNRIASFPVNLNIPEQMGQGAESSSEIIDATDDGMMLVYSDSPLGGIGMVDISDPANPQPGGFVALDGEPTAVVVQGGRAIVGLNTSESYTEPSGQVVSVNLASGEIEQSCDLGGQPDSLAISPDGTMVAIAIENERDEDLDDGVIPQMPAGFALTYRLASGAIDCDSRVQADLTGLAEVAGSDPEPEFVDINSANEVVVSLQENNHIVIFEGRTGEIVSHFSAGSVDLNNIDTREEGALTFDSAARSVVREPDAVKWLDNDRIVTANEGDYEGGSRGFTIFGKDGTVLFESGTAFEYEVAMTGHYPEERSGNKGVEPEGMEVGVYGGATHIFLLSERGSVIGVYADDPEGEPELKQILPSALGPEGAVAIPERNLLAVANEVDLIEDGGVRSHVTLYQLGEGPAEYPMIVSQMDEDGRPIGFGALSGLAADPDEAGILYAVNDSFYGMQPTIFTIDANQTPARITAATRVTRNGANAQLLDLEGIVADGEGGFWLASEGRTGRMIPHGLYHVNADGEIEDQVAFPPQLLAVERRHASEGVTMVGDTLWVAIQREWDDDPEGQVKLVAYNTETGEWGAVRYPLEPKGEGWVGLSEIVAHGDHVYIVERDNQIGAAAKLKKIFRVPLSEMQPAPLGGDLPVVTKEEVRDLIPDMAAFGGYVVDKVEGLAVDAAGNFFAVTDNDGVDDSNGETQFLRLGEL
ncbi:MULTISPECIES: esterase-like activity of phytase family protein [unclassified Roseitalea]|uniref:esterase-like activity of phytase family protein n=1 Tax=unclassified Roseitalea TaxID=2639107 RepID=UPI00273F6E03|nr:MULTISPECIES: esterase-like activity of phytase family protein [unclassified Roseitalea]